MIGMQPAARESKSRREVGLSPAGTKQKPRPTIQVWEALQYPMPPTKHADDQETGKVETRDSFVTLGGTQVRASTINVAILGSGNFGTAMGVLLAGKGVNVTIVVRKAEVADAINNEHVNPKSLGGLELPHNIGACTDPAAAFCCADFIFHAVPCQVGRRRANPHLNHGFTLHKP